MSPNPKGGIAAAAALDGGNLIVEGMLLDIDYFTKAEETYIRLTVKGTDGKAYEMLDKDFKPYFYLVPDCAISIDDLAQVTVADNDKTIKPAKITTSGLCLIT